jgi:hypothetical protein
MTDEEEADDVQMTHIEQVTGVVGEIKADEVVVNNSMVGVISANEFATLENNMTLVVAAGKNAQINQGMGMAVVAGQNIDLKEGGGAILNAGQNITINNGGGGLLICKQAEVKQSTIGVLLAGQASLDKDVRVLMTRNEAVAFGAAFGLAAAIFGFLFRRRR